MILCCVLKRLRAGKIAILRRGVWGAVLRAGGRLLELVDSVRCGTYLACLWACGYMV